MSEINQDTAATPLSSIKLPSAEALKRLAISETGFVFDPTTGHSFSINETGMLILQQLQQHKTLEETIQLLDQTYQAERTQFERDLIEFIGQLRKQIQENMF